MKYTEKLQELAAYVRRKEAGHGRPADASFEIRIYDKDPGYLRIELFEPFQGRVMASTGTLVTVSPYPSKGAIFLKINISATAIGSFTETQGRLLGIVALYRIAGALHGRVKDQEFEA